MEYDISYYSDYISPRLLNSLLQDAKPISEVDGLSIVAGMNPEFSEVETHECLAFICNLYQKMKGPLNKILEQRRIDRQFIDNEVRRCNEWNIKKGVDYTSPTYASFIGLKDKTGRVVVGPLSDHYLQSNKKQIAKIPEFLQGHHVTLFGPPDTEKMTINAMNSLHHKLPNEPKIVEQLLRTSSASPKWGADSEDSKTPLTSALMYACQNLIRCFTDPNFSYLDPVSGKKYQLKKTGLLQPIKRIPGFALPSTTHFFKNNPIPLHIFDFGMHFFHLWRYPKALALYIPKLENEEEAQYLKYMIEVAEAMIQQAHSEYQLGSIRVFIILENPRAIFRLNEIIDNLYPYFAGASLGWHDHLGSTARLFKEDSNYRIPIKADPNIVIKHIKESHELLSNIIGPRGGIKIGGMYGVLPKRNDPESFQVTMIGYIKDVITELKRGLDGFWVAHPDFVRLGIALVEAWKAFQKDPNNTVLNDLVCELVSDPSLQKDLIQFIQGEDVVGLEPSNPLYQRALLAADIKESSVMANNDPEEIRYNIFQALQYLADWLAGNGCVALPAQIKGAFVRVMDDLATTERSRWEVWHEIYHGRFKLEDFLTIAYEELNFIRKNMKSTKKEVQVQWDQRTDKWYPVAFKLLIRLMTDKAPVEFAAELLLTFTTSIVREAKDPWEAACRIDPDKYEFPPYIRTSMDKMP